jgi:glycosyltransferase involved in cell wall biosynthesis
VSSRNSRLYVATPYGRAGPSSRVRVWEWLDRIAVPTATSGYLGHHNASPEHIARHPIRVVQAEHRLRRMAASAPERLLLHREASPLSRGGLERQLLSAASFSCYDFDDALQWDTGQGGLLRRWAPKAAKALVAARLADRVIAGNEILAEWASEHNRDVVIVPSCVSPRDYREKLDYRCGDPPRLGWIGSRDNERYLSEIAPSLREIHRRTGARLTLIGTASPTLGELEAMIERVPWSERTQSDRIADFDVGISPMPDEPYTRGKCGYKLLQYAAAGTPVVASPIGVNAELLRKFAMPGPRTDTEWVDAILELLGRSADDRRRIGQAARQATIEGYSYDAWIGRWTAAVGLEALTG